MDIKKHILKRFISDKFSFNDYLSVSSWFKDEGYSSRLKAGMEDEWNETVSSGDNKGQLTIILDRLHHQIQHSTKNSTACPFENFYRKFSKVAAILLIPALITIAILSYFTFHPDNAPDSYTEIYAPLGTRAKFKLPDGTEGWLNSGSSIKYPVSFKNRRVEISGEAWFNVTHKKSVDFRVATPYFDVKVLGTKFNVVAYEDESTSEVILEKGKVAILDKKNKVKTDLIPDQQIIYNKTTRQLTKATIDAKSYTSWKDGILVFKNEPMSEIARRLGRKYNMEIILHSDSLKSFVFRATFNDESIDEICKLLSEVAPIRYKVSRRQILADKTFTKGRIDMWLKTTEKK